MLLHLVNIDLMVLVLLNIYCTQCLLLVALGIDHTLIQLLTFFRLTDHVGLNTINTQISQTCTLTCSPCADAASFPNRAW